MDLEQEFVVRFRLSEGQADLVRELLANDYAGWGEEELVRVFAVIGFDLRLLDVINVTRRLHGRVSELPDREV